MSLAEQLFLTGVVILPIFTNDELKEISPSFQDICLHPAEMKHISERQPCTRLALGGVGYVPCPSVFYHPVIRGMYKKTYDTVIDSGILNHYKNQRFKEGEITWTSLVPDRPLYRFVDQIVDENGKWHRDIAPKVSPDETIDICFGGWVNLNQNITQQFKCYLGTHRSDLHHPIYEKISSTGDLPNDGKVGFSSFNDKNQKVLKACFDTMGNIVNIPPGHLLIFRESLIHIVKKNIGDTDPIMRIHTSFLISSNPVPLHDRENIHQSGHKRKRSSSLKSNDSDEKIDLMTLFQNQAMIPVRSGQHTPTYSSFNLFPKSLPKLTELSNQYSSSCHDNNNRVLKFLPSLKELNLMHPDMTLSELQMYFPQFH